MRRAPTRSWHAEGYSGDAVRARRRRIRRSRRPLAGTETRWAALGVLSLAWAIIAKSAWGTLRGDAPCVGRCETAPLACSGLRSWGKRYNAFGQDAPAAFQRRHTVEIDILPAVNGCQMDTSFRLGGS